MSLMIIEIVAFVCAISVLPLGFVFVILLGMTMFHIWFGFDERC